MAIKTAKVTIAAEGRDKGKIFILTEMPAEQAERWALRALSALVASGVTIPDDVVHMGLAGVARMGVQAFGGIDFEKLEPLLAEMFACVAIQPGTDPNVVRTQLVADDIEEVATRFKLRAELFKLHMDFLKVALQSTQA